MICMSSLILAIFYIFSKLPSITASVFFRIFDAFPPQVPSFFAGYANGLLYALNPRAFLDRCQKKYGPVYRVSLGYRRLKIVSSGDAIASVFSTSPELLRNDVIHREMFYIVAGVTTNLDHLHEVMVGDLFPLVDKTLSPRRLGQTIHGFGLVLLFQVKKFAEDCTGPVSITALTNEPLYAATNHVVLGSAFPADTYRDFRTLSQSVPYRFTRTLLWRWPSDAARKRLLNALCEYLKQAELADCDDQFSRAFVQVFRDNNIQSSEGAKLVLNFLWGVHSNILSNSLFLLSFLLNDQDAFARVRSEIDVVIERFGGLEPLLAAGPDELDDPSFQLLTSAIMETMRLTGLHVGIRQAKRDFDLKVKDGFIPIKEGEYVFGNVYAAHMDARVFPHPETFVVDRFAQQPYRRRQLQTGRNVFHSLGGGKHICKGRWLAIYEIKVLMIILLHTFDFSSAEGDSTACRPLRVHPRSIGVVHTEDDILVRLTPRQH